jgi:predicted small lipoprotein YifL
MKTKKVLFTLATTALLAGLAGCGKQENASLEDQAKTAATEASDAVKKTADSVKETGEKVVQDVKEAGQKAAQDVTDKAKEVVAPVNAKAQGIIDAAKQYVSDGKLQEAYTKLKELGGEKLSAEQQAIADSLKAQIDKLLGTTNKAATDAAGAAGNLLKK